MCFAVEVPLRDHDYLRLQFLGARNSWLGCPQPVCGLYMCPSRDNYYQNFEKCYGEVFQIIAEGSIHGYVKSGQHIRLRYVHQPKTWMGCASNNRCEQKTCSGTLLQARNFSKCGEEILRLYARGKKDGEIVYSGDVVMVYYSGRYVAIQGQDNRDETSLDFCPATNPPAYLSYGICSKNVFRVYRKP